MHSRRSVWVDDELAIRVIVALAARPGFDCLGGAMGPPIWAEAIKRW